MPFTIVYLDDETELCELFVDYFSSDEVQVKSFENEEFAIHEIKTNPPDLVFLDLNLFSTTGEKVAARIDPNIPKALITGDIRINSKPPFLKVFHKPLDFDLIDEFIGSVREKRTK